MNFDKFSFRSKLNKPLKTRSLATHWYYKKERQMFGDFKNPLFTDAMKGRILYIGGFHLPDKNAAAQRVVANAKLFREIGYETVFLSYSQNVEKPNFTKYFGFDCFECPANEWNAARIDIDRVIEVAGYISGLVGIIAYNYPAFGLSKIQKFCNSKKIKCIGDITEWYSAADVSALKKLPKAFDTFWRMHRLNKRCDALIVISDYLEQYYIGMKLLKLPPLVDPLDKKWPKSCNKTKQLSIVYAGKPSRTKERLDLICEAVLKLPDEIPITLNVIGITAPQYEEIYRSQILPEQRINFLGQLSHENAIKQVSNSTYAVIVRDDNRVTRAGFPTKFAESITSGTPVIANDNSDIRKYIEDFECGWLVDEATLSHCLEKIASSKVPSFPRNIFDFRNYVKPAEKLFNELFTQGMD